MRSSLWHHAGFVHDSLRNEPILVQKARKLLGCVADWFECALDQLPCAKLRLTHDARDLNLQPLNDGFRGAGGGDQTEVNPREIAVIAQFRKRGDVGK